MERYRFVVENGDMVDGLDEAIPMVVSLASGVGTCCVCPCRRPDEIGDVLEDVGDRLRRGERYVSMRRLLCTWMKKNRG